MKTGCALLLLASLIGLGGCGASKPLPMLTEDSKSAASATPQQSTEAARSQSRPQASAGGGGGGRVAWAYNPTQEASAHKTEGGFVQISDQDLAKSDSSYADRKVIRNAELSLQTQDPMGGQQKVQSIAESLGGFVVDTDVKHSNSASQSPPNTTITMSIRVPSARFVQALDAVRTLGDRVLEEKAIGQDVTEEYIDLEARIRTQKALESQFLEIMKRATKISDALEVQSQISEVRGEIERLEGRRRFLENKSSLSTIKVTLQTAPPIIAATQAGFIDNTKQAVGDAFDTAAAIINGAIRIVGVMIPVTMLILLPGALVLRFVWRRLPVNKTVPPSIVNAE